MRLRGLSGAAFFVCGGGANCKVISAIGFTYSVFANFDSRVSFNTPWYNCTSSITVLIFV